MSMLFLTRVLRSCLCNYYGKYHNFSVDWMCTLKLKRIDSDDSPAGNLQPNNYLVAIAPYEVLVISFMFCHHYFL